MALELGHSIRLLLEEWHSVTLECHLVAAELYPSQMMETEILWTIDIRRLCKCDFE